VPDIRVLTDAKKGERKGNGWGEDRSMIGLMIGASSRISLCQWINGIRGASVRTPGRVDDWDDLKK